MRIYLLIFVLVIIALAGIGDQFLISSVKETLVGKKETQLRESAAEIAEYLKQNLPSSSPEQVEIVLSQLSGLQKQRFQLINSQFNLWYDSAAADITDIDQSNKPEMIGINETGSRFKIRDHAMYFAKSLNHPHLDGTLRVYESYRPIEKMLTQIRNFIWTFAALTALIGSGLIFVFARRSLSPLNEFANVARMIGIGKYDTVPALHGRRDKWKTLSEAFRHMQQELEKREINILDNSARLQAVLSSMIEGVLAIDSKGRVMLANGAACDMLQLAHSEIFGRVFVEIFRIPELSEAIEKTQNDRTFSQCEFQTRELPRKIISARVSVLSYSQSSRMPGIAIVFHDVTDLRQLETMRRDFVANVSHELKTPLASIKAYAETLKLGAIDDRQKNVEFVEHIESQADLLNEQIQDLIQLARVESGQKHWEIAPISISEIATTCIKRFATEADSRKIAVTLSPSEEELFVKADRDGVETILSNLISNALHYTTENGHVEVRISNLNSFVKIEIDDDGIGISPDHHARIFERFYRVDKARSREHGGTGLGLAIVKHLCQAFGGSVELKSSLGTGSCFIVKLPNARR